MEARNNITLEQFYVKQAGLIHAEWDKLHFISDLQKQMLAAYDNLSELWDEANALNLYAKQALQEVKENPNNLYFIRERSRKIEALLETQMQRIKQPGKLNIPKLPTFDDVLKQVRINLDGYLTECDAIYLAGIDQAHTKNLNEHYRKVTNNVYSACENRAKQLVELRKKVVGLKDKLGEVVKENCKMSVELADATIKRSEELMKDGADKFVEKMSSDELQAAYVELTAKAKKGDLGKGEAKEEVVKPQLQPLPDKGAAEKMMKDFVRNLFTSTVQSAPPMARSSNVAIISRFNGVSESKEGERHSPPTPPGLIKTVTHTPEEETRILRRDSTPPDSPNSLNAAAPASKPKPSAYGDQIEGQPAIPSYNGTAHARFNGKKPQPSSVHPAPAKKEKGKGKCLVM